MQLFIGLIVCSFCGVAVSLSVVAGKGNDDLACPEGFERWQRSCYKFSRLRGTWLQAQGFCRAMRADLASVDYAQESRYLATYIQKNRYVFKRSFWIGGNDFAEDRDWRWVRTSERVKYDNWYHGQPDNVGGREHCIALEKKYGYKWNDKFCALRLHFVCEIPLHE